MGILFVSGKLKRLGSLDFKKPLVEQIAIRWQDRCLQIRLAAQELLVAELKNMGPHGRRNLVEKWRGFLPKYGDPPFQQQQTNGQPEVGGRYASLAGQSGSHPGDNR